MAEAEEEEEEEEDEEEDELQRVSTPVLVIFCFRLFARGALSTLFRKKPSLFPRLKAWEPKKKKNYKYKTQLLCIYYQKLWKIFTILLPYRWHWRRCGQ